MPDIKEFIEQMKKRDAEARENNEKYNSATKAERKKQGLTYKEIENPFENISSPYYNFQKDPYRSIEEVVPNNYWQAAIEGEWDFFDVPEDMESAAFETMEGGNMRKKMWQGFKDQFSESFTRMFKSWNTITGLDSYYAHEDIGQSLDKILAGQGTQIYSDPNAPRMRQKAYWAQQVQSLGLSAGILAEQLIETALTWGVMSGVGAIKGAMSLGKVAGLARTANIAKRAKAANNSRVAYRMTFNEALASGKSAAEASKIAREAYNISTRAKNWNTVFEMAKNGVVGATQGAKNAYLNMGYTEDEAYTKYLQAGLSEDEARTRAAMEGRAAFYTELIPQILINSAQWGIIRGMGKTHGSLSMFGKKMSNPDGLVDVLLDKIGPKSKAGSFATGLLAEGLLEGTQEAFEEFASMRGQKLGYEGKNWLGREMSDKYTKGYGSLVGSGIEQQNATLSGNADRYIDNFIGGVIGGLIFGAAGKGVQAGVEALFNKNSQHKNDEASIKAFETRMRETLRDNTIRAAALKNKRAELEDEYKSIIEDNSLTEDEKSVKIVDVIERMDGLAREEDALQNDLIGTFKLAYFANQSLEENSKLDYVADVTTEMGQAIDAAQTVLNLDSESVERLKRDAKKIEENDAKPKEQRLSEEELGLESKNKQQQKELTNYLFLKNLEENGEKNALIDENGNITIDALKSYLDTKKKALEEWGLIVSDFSNYYMGFANDADAAIRYAELQHGARLGRVMIDEATTDLYDVVPGLNNIVKNKRAFFHALGYIFPQAKKHVRVNYSEMDKDIAKESLMGFLSNGTTSKFTLSGKQRLVDAYLSEQEDFNKVLEEVSREEAKKKKELDDTNSEIEKLNAVINDNTKTDEEKRNAEAQRAELIAKRDSLKSQYDGDPGFFVSDLIEQENSPEFSTEEKALLRHLIALRDGKGSTSEFAKQVFERLFSDEDGYSSFMGRVISVGEMEQSVVNAEAMAEAMTSHVGYKYYSLILEAGIYKKHLENTNRKKDIEKAIKRLDKIVAKLEDIEKNDLSELSDVVGNFRASFIDESDIRRREEIRKKINKSLRRDNRKIRRENRKIRKEEGEEIKKKEYIRYDTDFDKSFNIQSRYKKDFHSQESTMNIDRREKLKGILNFQEDLASVKNIRALYKQRLKTVENISRSKKTDPQQTESQQNQQINAQVLSSELKDPNSTMNQSMDTLNTALNEMKTSIVNVDGSNVLIVDKGGELETSIEGHDPDEEYTEDEKSVMEEAKRIHIASGDAYYEEVESKFGSTENSLKGVNTFREKITFVIVRGILRNGLQNIDAVLESLNNNVYGIRFTKEQLENIERCLNGVIVAWDLQNKDLVESIRSVYLNTSGNMGQFADIIRAYFYIRADEQGVERKIFDDTWQNLSTPNITVNGLAVSPDSVSQTEEKNNENEEFQTNDEKELKKRIHDKHCTQHTDIELFNGIEYSESSGGFFSVFRRQNGHCFGSREFSILSRMRSKNSPVKRVFINHVVDDNLEDMLIDRFSVRYGKNENPIYEYLYQKDSGFVEFNSGNNDKNMYDPIGTARKVVRAIRDGRIKLEDVLSHTYTPVYAELDNGEEVEIGFINSEDYFTTRDDVGQDSNENTIPNYFKDDNGKIYEDMQRANAMRDKIRSDIREIALRSKDGEVELDIARSESASNDIMHGKNRKLEDKEKEIKDLDIIQPGKNKKGEYFVYYGNGASASANKSNMTEGMVAGGTYIMIKDEVSDTDYPAHMIIPGMERKSFDPNTNEESVEYASKAENWDLSKEAPELYNEFHARVANYFIHYMLNVIKNSGNDARTLLMEMLDGNDDKKRKLREFLMIDDVNVAVDNLLKIMDNIGSSENDMERVLYQLFSPDNDKRHLLNARVWNVQREEDIAKMNDRENMRSYFHLSKDKFFIGKSTFNPITYSKFGVDRIGEMMYAVAYMFMDDMGAKNMMASINHYGRARGESLFSVKVTDIINKNCQPAENTNDICGYSENAQSVWEYVLDRAYVNTMALPVEEVAGRESTTTIYIRSNISFKAKESSEKQKNDLPKTTQNNIDEAVSNKNLTQEQADLIKEELAKTQNPKTNLKDLDLTGIKADNIKIKPKLSPVEINNVKYMLFNELKARLKNKIFNMTTDEILDEARKILLGNIFKIETDTIEKKIQAFEAFCKSYPDDKEAENKLSELKSEHQKLMSLTQEDTIDMFLRNEQYSKGKLTRLLIDTFEDKGWIDIDSTEEFDADDEAEETVTGTPNPNIMSHAESFEASRQPKVSAYLRMAFTGITKPVQKKTYDNIASSEYIQDFATFDEVLNILRAYAVDAGNFNNLKRALEKAVMQKAENYEIIEQILDIFNNNFPQQYANELCDKIVKSAVGMMFVLHNNGEGSVVSVDVSQQWGRAYGEIKRYISGNPFITDYDKKTDKHKINKKSFKKILNAIDNIGRNTPKSQIAKIFYYITGYKLGDNTLDNFYAMEYAKSCLYNYSTFFNRLSVEDPETFDKWLNGSMSIENLVIEVQKGKYTYDYTVTQFMNQNSALKRLIQKDIVLNVQPVEAQSVINGKNVLLTYNSTLKNKVFNEVNAKGPYYGALKDIFDGRRIQVGLYEMPLKTGLVSISAMSRKGKNSDRITKLSEAENECVELNYSQQIDDLPQTSTFAFDTFGGKRFSMTQWIRYGYELSLTNSNKRKLSWVKLPKFFIDSNPEKVIDYTTHMAVGEQLFRFFNEMKAYLESDGKHFNRKNLNMNFNISDLNLIKVKDINGEECYLFQYLESAMASKDIQSLEDMMLNLKSQYDTIFSQARDIVEAFISKEVKDRIGFYPEKSSSNIDVDLYKMSKELDDVENSSWARFGIIDVVNTQEGPEIRTTVMNREFLNAMTKLKLEEHNKTNGRTITKKTLFYTALDRVINAFIADMFVQDSTYGSLNDYEGDYESIKEEIMDIMSDKNKTNEEKESEIRQIMADLCINSTKSAGRAMNKRMAGIDTGGSTPNFEDEEFIYLVVDETKRDISKLEMKYRIQCAYGENIFSEEVDKGLTVEECLDYIYGDKNNSSEYKKKLSSKLPKIKDFFGISSSDGQEMITWKEAIDCIYARGKMSTYDMERMKRIEQQLTNNEPISMEDYEFLCKNGINAQKPVYDGTHIIKGKDGKALGLQNMYVKSSAMILLPQFTKNTELDEVRRKLEEIQEVTGKNVRLAFNSAVKVNTISGAVKFEDMCNPDKKAVIDGVISAEFSRSCIDAQRKFLSVQQETDNHMVSKMKQNTLRRRQEKMLGEMLSTDSGYEILLTLSKKLAEKGNLSKKYKDALVRMAVVRRENSSSYGNIVIRGIIDDFVLNAGFKNDDKEYSFNADSILLNPMSFERSIASLFNTRTGISDIKNIFELFDSDSDVNFSLMELMFEPTETEVVEATQIHNLLLADGFSKINEKIFKLPKEVCQRFDVVGDTIDGDNKNVLVSGEQLSKIRTEMYKQQVEEESKKLLRIFGVDSYDKIDLNSQKHMMRLQDLIVKELERTGMSENTMKQLGIIREDDKYVFKIPMLFNSSSQRVESLLMALVRNRICRSHINGNAYYTTTSEGFKIKPKKMTREQLINKGVVWLDKDVAENGLSDFYKSGDNVIHAQCAVAPRFTYLGNDGEEHIIDFYSTEKDKNGKEVFRYLLHNGNKVEVIRKNGEIDINKVAKACPDGLYLNSDMIDQRALEMMSLRIPTSGHMSCVMLEIKAFLPPSMGEAIIVPFGNIAQLGEDFDIDKRFCYFRHAVVAKDGKIKVIDQEYIENFKKDYNESLVLQKLRDVKKSIKTVKDAKEITATMINQLNEYLQKLEDEYHKIKEPLWEGEEEEKYLQEMRDLFDNRSKLLEMIQTDSKKLEWLDDVIERLMLQYDMLRKNRALFDMKVRRLEEKAKENHKIDVYLSVFGCDYDIVQKEINKVLGWDLYKDTKKVLIEKSNAEKPKNDNGYLLASPFSKIYQQHLRKENSDSQMGVGLSSLSVVINGLIQQGNVKIKDFNMKVCGITSDGNLSNPRMNGNVQMAKTEEYAALQNINLDTVKADIIGFINQNKHTYSFYTMMCLLGFGPINTDMSKNPISVPAMVCVQNIVKEYVKMLSENENDLTIKRSRQTILEETLKKFGVSDSEIEELRIGNTITKSIIESGEKHDFYFLMKNGTIQLVDEKGNATDNYDGFTIEDLISMYAKENLADDNLTRQLIILSLFQRVGELSKSMNKFQKLLNASSTGVGKNYSEVRQRISYLNDLKKADEQFVGIASLIGDFIEKDEYAKLDKAQKAEYFKFNGCDYYIKPTTVSGYTLLNALKMSEILIGDVFGYNNKYINYILDEIEQLIVENGLYFEDAEFIRKKVLRDFRQYVQKAACDSYWNPNKNDTLFGGMTLHQMDNMIFGSRFEKAIALLAKKDKNFARETANDVIDFIGYEETGLVNKKTEQGNVLLLTFSDLIYFLKNIKPSRLYNNEFFKIFDTDVAVVRVKVGNDRFSADEISEAFMDLFNDDEPFYVTDSFGADHEMRVYMYDGKEYTVSPKFIAKLFLINAMISDNANGVLEYKQFIPFEIMEYYGLDESFRKITKKIDESAITDDENTNTLFMETTSSTNQNETKQITTKNFIDNFVLQFMIRYPRQLVSSVSYYKIHGKRAETNQIEINADGEMTISFGIDDYNKPGGVNHIRSLFGLNNVADKEQKLEPKNLIPEIVSIYKNGQYLVFRQTNDKVIMSNGGTAVTIKYELVNDILDFGQNNYDPYNEFRPLRKNQQLEALSITKGGSTMDRHIKWAGSSTGEAISRMITNLRSKNPILRFYSKCSDYFSNGRFTFQTHGNIVNPGEKGNFVQRNGDKIDIHISPDWFLSQKYKEEVVIEELTHALLLDYVRQNYDISIKDGKFEYTIKGDVDVRLGTLMRKYSKFNEWWLNGHDGYTCNEKSYEDMAEHVATNFDEFIAAFMACDVEFVRMLDAFESSNYGSYNDNSATLFKIMLQKIKQIIEALRDAVLAKIKEAGITDENRVNFLTDEISNIQAALSEIITENFEEAQKTISANDVISSSSATLTIPFNKDVTFDKNGHQYMINGSPVKDQINASSLDFNSNNTGNSTVYTDLGNYVDSLLRVVFSNEFIKGDYKKRQEMLESVPDEKDMKNNVDFDMFVKIPEQIDNITSYNIYSDEHPMAVPGTTIKFVQQDRVLERKGTLCGTPDLVMTDKNRIHIIDFKTSQGIDTYEQKYAGQLAAYGYLIGSQNAGIQNEKRYYIFHVETNRKGQVVRWKLKDYTDTVMNSFPFDVENKQIVSNGLVSMDKNMLISNTQKGRLPNIC